MKIIDVFEAGICKKSSKCISIVCPICKTVLLKQSSEPVQMAVCNHVRFRWDSGELIEFFGEWNHSTFANNVLTVLDTDEHLYSFDNGIQEETLSLSDCYVQSNSMIEVLEKIDDKNVLQIIGLYYSIPSCYGTDIPSVLLWGLYEKAPKLINKQVRKKTKGA